MKAAMVTTFKNPIPGREKAAMAYGRQVDDFFEKKASDGMCTEPRTFWAPDGKNIWFVEGEYEALLGLMATPEAEKFQVQGKLLLEDFGYGVYLTDNDAMMHRFELALAELDMD